MSEEESVPAARDMALLDEVFATLETAGTCGPTRQGSPLECPEDA